MKCLPRPHFEDWNKPFQTWGIRRIALTVTVKEKRGRESSLEGKWWLRGKESAFSAGATTDMECIPGLGRCPGGGNSSPPQYSCLENPVDRGAWWAIIHKVTKSCARLKRVSMQGKKTKTQKQTYIQNEVYFMKEYLEESEKGTREKQDSGWRGNNWWSENLEESSLGDSLGSLRWLDFKQGKRLGVQRKHGQRGPENIHDSLMYVAVCQELPWWH